MTTETRRAWILGAASIVVALAIGTGPAANMAERRLSKFLGEGRKKLCSMMNPTARLLPPAYRRGRPL